MIYKKGGLFLGSAPPGVHVRMHELQLHRAAGVPLTFTDASAEPTVEIFWELRISMSRYRQVVSHLAEP